MTAIALDNLAAFGVEEMNTDSAEQVAGLLGWPDLAGALIAAVIIEVVENPGAVGRAFMEGFRAAS
jgi:hypothetical protein